MDAGDVPTLERLLAEHPELLRERLRSPGPWLHEKVAYALKRFFKHPYLLWFVAEDPVRNGKLPKNIAQVARTIIEAARRAQVKSLQKQVDYALRLVAWSWIARECGVQIELIDVLLDAGAPPGETDNALVNGNFEAARHLVARGAPVTLATALCLERWADVLRLAPKASARERQFAFVLAALNGRAEALRRMLMVGVPIDRPSRNLYSHGTPLHHAVCSGSLEAVQVLVEAGADTSIRDKAWGGTPLGWAEHYQSEKLRDRRGRQYDEIAEYLRQE